MNKYKTPNGNTLSESELISQYGAEKFAQFLNEGKITLVTDQQEVYITPNGKELTENELISQYGQDKFNTFLESGKVKKKNSNGTGDGTSQMEVVESATGPTPVPGTSGSFEKDTLIERKFGKNFATDFLGDIYRATKQGQGQGATVDDALGLMYDGKDATPEQIQLYLSEVNKMNQFGPSDEMRQFQKIYEDAGSGTWGFIKGLAATRGQVIPQLFVSSASAMFNESSGKAAAVGAVVGSAVPVFGTIGGAIGAAGATLETAMSFTDFLQGEVEKAGLAFDKDGVTKILNNPEAMGRIRRKSLGRGIAIGAIDGLTGGIAGKATSSSLKAAKTIGKRIGAGAKGVAIEGVGGSIGEATGRLLTGQELDVAEIGFEGVAGTATAPLTVGSSFINPPSYQLNGKPASFDDVNDLIINGTPDEIAGAKIEIKNDKNLLAKAEGKKRDAQIGANLQSDIPNYISEDDRVNLTKLETELEVLSGSNSVSAKIKAEGLSKEIKDIYSKYKDIKNESVEVSFEFAKQKLKEENEVLLKAGLPAIKETKENIIKKQNELIDDSGIVDENVVDENVVDENVVDESSLGILDELGIVPPKKDSTVESIDEYFDNELNKLDVENPKFEDQRNAIEKSREESLSINENPVEDAVVEDAVVEDAVVEEDGTIEIIAEEDYTFTDKTLPESLKGVNPNGTRSGTDIETVYTFSGQQLLDNNVPPNVVMSVNKPPKGPPNNNESVLGDSDFDANVPPNTVNEEGFWQRVDKNFSNFKTKFVDKFNPVRDIQKNLEKKLGKTFKRGKNFDTAEKTLYGRTRSKLDNFEKSISKVIKKITNKKLDVDQVSKYLYAKHATERNKFIRETRRPDDPKYDSGSGITDKQAEDILNGFTPEQTKELELVANDFYEITQGTLDIMLDENLISKTEYDNIKNNEYKNYVPLKGFANENISEAMDQIVSESGRKGLSIQGKDIGSTSGRTTEAGDVISNIIAARSAVIIRSQKNETLINLLNIVQENKDSSAYNVYTANTPDSKLGTNKEGAKVLVPVDINEMRDKPGKYTRVLKGGQEYFIKFEDQQINTILNDANPGKTSVWSKYIQPTFASVNNILRKAYTTANPEFIATNYIRDLQTGIMNALADSGIKIKGGIKGTASMIKTLGVNSALSFKVINAFEKGKTLDAEGNVLSDKELKAKGYNPEIVKYYNEFVKEGGKTGYFFQESTKNIKKGIDGMAKMASEKKGVKTTAKQWAKNVSSFVDGLNAASENSTRLAAFIEARKQGMEAQKAAALAKELTVNFNQSGTAGPALNSFYLFLNAGIQGTTRFTKAMNFISKEVDPLTSKTKFKLKKVNPAQKVAMGITAGSAVIAAINEHMSEEDEDGETFYSKIPAAEKERNLIIMNTDGRTYTKIPLPYGYNIFSNLGTAAYDLGSGKKTTGQTTGFLGRSFLGAFSPINFSKSKNLTSSIIRNGAPTALKPFADLSQNENFFGGQIFNENFEGSTPKPDSELGRNQNGKEYRLADWNVISKWLNKATGGSEAIPGFIDANPESFKYIIDHYVGGLGRFIRNSVEVTDKIISGEKIDQNKTPFARRLGGEVNRAIDRNSYYDRKNDLKLLVAELEKVKQGKETKLPVKVLGQASALVKLSKKFDKRLKNFREIKVKIRKIKEYDRKNKSLKKIEDAEDKLYDAFNKTYLKFFEREKELFSTYLKGK